MKKNQFMGKKKERNLFQYQNDDDDEEIYLDPGTFTFDLHFCFLFAERFVPR